MNFKTGTADDSRQRYHGIESICHRNLASSVPELAKTSKTGRHGTRVEARSDKGHMQGLCLLHALALNYS